jgi:hypothetical protein
VTGFSEGMRENNFHIFWAKDTRFANCLGPSTSWTSDDQTCDEASTYGTVEAFAEVIIIKLQRDLKRVMSAVSAPSGQETLKPDS